MDKEDKLVAQKVWGKAAVEVQQELNSSKDGGAEAILVESAEEVNKYYDIPTDDVKVDDVEEKKAEEDSVVESEDDDDNGENDDDELDGHDINLNASLIIASCRNRVDQVKLLLKRRAYYFCRDRHGWTPLHWAASKGNTEIMEILLEHRTSINPNLKPYLNAMDAITGWTPLHVRTPFSVSLSFQFLFHDDSVVFNRWLVSMDTKMLSSYYWNIKPARIKGIYWVKLL